MKVRIILLAALACAFSVSIFAQRPFDKPFQKWNRDEAQKLLNESPWVTTYQSVEGLAAADKQAILTDQDSSNAARTGPRATDARAQAKSLSVPLILVRLHSALVVREALVRLQQISANYDKMDEGKRTAFDASTKDIIDCPYCKNYYIVTMNKSINTSHQTVEDGLFQTITAAQMKGMVWLVNDTGVRSPLAQFLPPKGSNDPAIFFFPRRDTSGKELIAPDSKNFKIEFSGDFFASKNPYASIIPRSFQFDVAKLVHDNQLVF